MSAHTYASSYPPPDTTPVDPAVARFFERFYAASDDRDAPLDDYVGLFAPDAVFVLASKKSVGHDGEMSLTSPPLPFPIHSSTKLQSVVTNYILLRIFSVYRNQDN